MRVIKTTAVSMLAISLVAGSTVWVSAEETQAESTTEPQKAAEVLGSSKHGHQYEDGHTVVGEGKGSLLGEAWEVDLRDMSDPRLDGTMRTVYNRDTYFLIGDVKSFATRIDNEHGSWLGTGQGYAGENERDWYFEALYAGEGAYEGLSALLFILDQEGRFNYYGLVFPGELPAVPEMPEPTTE